MGDSNAPHTYCHYTYDTPKGQKLADAKEVYGLQLISDPTQSTRLVQEGTRHTGPDLTLTNDCKPTVSWFNTMETFESDHGLTHISISTAKFCDSPGTAKITDWVKLRGMQSRLRSRAHTAPR
ncbi:hypothetical protein HPB48_011193 [Haemaphysalis longicornis]|uniref:Endonuclease/exonuclease/phosphatase domain-containing protein n=1 Tax=Haemaphysalis longicornis TaxID=44386 RepID=A0A9J6FD36_HAELO|nr:hypothetical protein HPB48_011193 [Haemaphysalis longicornis]